MNIKYKEPQFELFPASSASLEDINKPKFLLATLTLSTESVVMLVILGIMIGLFSFSLGVEQGKRLAAQSLDEKVAAAWNVGGRRLAVVTNTPVVTTTPGVSTAAKITGHGGFFHARTLVSATPVIVPHPAIGGARSGVIVTGGKWTVQVGTYRNEDYARQEALGLKAKGYPVFLIKSKDFYLVCIGQYAFSSQAQVFANKNQTKFLGSQVRRF